MLVTSSDVECALRTAIPALHRCTPSTPARKSSGTDHRCTRGRDSIAAAHLGALLEATGTTLPRTAPAAAHLRRPRLWLARTLPTSPYGSATPTRTGSSACSRKRSAASLHEQGPTCALARPSETQRGHICVPSDVASQFAVRAAMIRGPQFLRRRLGPAKANATKPRPNNDKTLGSGTINRPVQRGSVLPGGHKNPPLIRGCCRSRKESGASLSIVMFWMR